MKLFQHRHWWKVVGHERSDGPGELIGSTYFFPDYRATFWLVMACDCGQVKWSKYERFMAQGPDGTRAA